MGVHVLYDCVCMSEGGGIHYESLREGGLRNVEVRVSLSGRVKASPLICPYPTEEICAELRGRPTLD